MSAYAIGQLEILDPDEYRKYLAGFMPIFERHGGQLLATSNNETDVVEGTWAFPKTVIMKFPSMQHARNWHADPEYRALANHRLKSARTNLAIVDGIDGEQDPAPST